MELSKVILLVGVGVPFVGGLLYIAATAIINAGRRIDDALAYYPGEDDE